MADQSNNQAMDDKKGSTAGAGRGGQGGPTAAQATQNKAINKASASTTSSSNSEDLPGKRPFNPLSKLSSYTYHITFYLVDPSKMNDIVSTGGKEIRGTGVGNSSQLPGLYIIAQSGGINNNTEIRGLTLSGDPGTEGFDYYIDELTFATIPPIEGTSDPSQSMDFKFKIYEPNSFNFVQKLTNLCGQIDAGKSLGQYQYMLGIKFYGYGPNGELVTSKLFNQDEPVFTLDNATDTNSVFERFYPIALTDFKFELQGKTVVYNIGAIGYGFRYGQSNRGVLTKSFELHGNTVEELLVGVINGGDTAKEFFSTQAGLNGRENSTGTTQQSGNMAGSKKPSAGAAKGLIPMINQQYEDERLTNTRKIAPRIYIQFEDSPAGKAMRTAIVSSADKTQSAAGTSKNTNKSTVQASKAAQQSTTSGINYPVRAGTPIIQVIDDIISSSSYITNALNKSTSGGPESNGNNKTPSQKLKWYTITPLVKVAGTDTNLNDWAYDICYQIQPYSIPYIRSQYVGAVEDYKGPHKKYEYWYTGQNTEILNYTQEYNWLFMNLESEVPNGTNRGLDPKAKYIGPIQPVGSSQGSPTSAGGANRDKIINQTVKASLYSPTDNAQAKLKIIGDPDYLNQTSVLNSSLYDPQMKYYNVNDGFSINFNSSQIFIEILFKNALDYDTNGLMLISDDIVFDTEDVTRQLNKKGIKGLVYKIIGVEHSFVKGKFEQVLDLIIAPTELLSITDGTGTDDGRPATGNGNGTGARTNDNANSNNNQGTLKADANQSQAETNRLLAANKTPTSPSMQSSKDDANNGVYTTPGGAAFVGPSLGRR